MRIYVLTEGEYSEAGNVGVFSSREKAIEAAIRRTPDGVNCYRLYVDEWKRLGSCPFHHPKVTPKLRDALLLKNPHGGAQCPVSPEPFEKFMVEFWEFYIEEYELDSDEGELSTEGSD